MADIDGDSDGHADEDYALEAERVQAVREAIEAEDSVRIGELLAPLHPADTADLIEQLGERLRRDFVTLWGSALQG
ncbi:MAG: magnesium transporter, partial [Pseudomonadota bacterium]